MVPERFPNPDKQIDLSKATGGGTAAGRYPSALSGIGGRARQSAPNSIVRSRVIKWALAGAASIWAADILYREIQDISYVNREQCVLFRVLPRPASLAFEYVFETLIIVFVSTFIAVWLGRRVARARRFFPGNPLSAFAYASLIPVCSCAAIPLIGSMRGRLRFSTTLSFVLAAPLLSPHIIVLSFSVLGSTYGMLRIISSFVMVMFTVLVLGLFNSRDRGQPLTPLMGGCDRGGCAGGGDVYLEAFRVFRGLLPFLLVAGALGIALEYLGPRTALLAGRLGEGPAGIMTWILVGIPLYFCNGAEVLFLRPLMSHGLPVGTGIAFSMTSTVVCTTSIAMLLKMLGTRTTLLMVACVVGISLAVALLMNAVV
jgi:uncharacterized membrane protein YraQ (UPF0718 family)